MKKKHWHTILRIVVGAGLIVFLLSRTNLPELLRVLSSANIWWLLLALLLELLRVFICTYRWRVLLSAKGIGVPLGSLTSFYFVGNFFNIFLPTVLGGDAMRTYELARYSEKTADSITSVLIERIIGFLALFVICWLSLAISGLEWLKGTHILPIASGFSAAFLLLLVLLFNRRLMSKVISSTKIIRRWNIESKLNTVYNSLYELTTHRRSLCIAFGASLAHQFVGILSTFLISKALGLEVSFFFFLVVMPLIWVIMMIPVSIAGLGIREGAFVYFFTQYGVPISAALLLSLLFFSLGLVIATVGGAVYGLGRYRQRAIFD